MKKVGFAVALPTLQFTHPTLANNSPLAMRSIGFNPLRVATNVPSRKQQHPLTAALPTSSAAP
ncbi:hypothetical protein QUF54_02740 [Candidatus Marithioploca araucensis]|uniref:Uncharacterized protein n=1 Tax=Candidatus Marithioploca araucensis TaxID=70273 RepID=A0ABT7VRF6_9GAMM|nr:hypothetical protein [Candidatus Marithioploca araucensis]